jgi:HSP20 family protein
LFAVSPLARCTQFLLHADLPGLSDDDVKVEILDGVMTISGERKLEREETTDGRR